MRNVQLGLLLTHALTFIPICGYVLLEVLVGRATRQVGHWPILKGPDPSVVWFFHPGDGVGLFVWLGVMAALPLSWLGAMLIVAHAVDLLMRRRGALDGRTVAHVAWQCCACALGLALFMREFGRMAYWLLD